MPRVLRLRPILVLKLVGLVLVGLSRPAAGARWKGHMCLYARESKGMLRT